MKASAKISNPSGAASLNVPGGSATVTQSKATTNDIPCINGSSLIMNPSGGYKFFKETDPTVPAWVKAITEQDIYNWNNSGGNETDPVFTESPAYLISLPDISNWDTALLLADESHSWGNHALAGYLTEETAFNNSVAATIDLIDIFNWNEAFLWGNHADANYATVGGTDGQLQYNNNGSLAGLPLEYDNILNRITGNVHLEIETDADYPVLRTKFNDGVTVSEINQGWNGVGMWAESALGSSDFSLTSYYMSFSLSDGITGKSLVLTSDDITLTWFAGSGTRMVVANSAGVLSTQAIPVSFSGDYNDLSNKPILGTLTAGRVPFVGAGGLIQDSARIIWDNTNFRFGIGANTSALSATLQVTGNAGITSNTTAFTVTSDSSAVNLFNVFNANYIFTGRLNDTTALPSNIRANFNIVKDGFHNRGALLAGNYTYAVDGSLATSLFPSGTVVDRNPGIVGLSSSLTSEYIDIPSIASNGGVGVVGAAGMLTGNKTLAGVYGHAYYSRSFANANHSYGGYFTTRMTVNVTDYQGNTFGVYGKGDISGATSAISGNVYGGRFEAVGKTGVTTYGIWIGSNGGTTNYGIWQDNAASLNRLAGSITTLGYVKFGSYTTAQRNALTGSEGMVIFNTDVGIKRLQYYDGSVWLDV